MAKVKTYEELRALRDLGKRHAQVLRALCERVVPGVTSSELEAHTRRLIKEVNAEPAFLGYKPAGAPRPYPCALCIAPNDIVVHGIPTELDYTVREGDIVGLDIGLTRDGVITDAGHTIAVGEVGARTRELLAVTEEALTRAIAVARAGNTVGDIGYAVESYVHEHGFGIVRDLCGHGVGTKVHEEPQVPNYGVRGTGERLVAGMVLALEPMVNERKGGVIFERDGYTVRTKDGSRSAHFEHDIIVTEGEAEVLTRE